VSTACGGLLEDSRKAEIRDQGTEIRDQGTGNREQGTGNREQRTENREQGTGNREQRTGNREQGTGNEIRDPAQFWAGIRVVFPMYVAEVRWRNRRSSFDLNE
jgi:hypothetical protein